MRTVPVDDEDLAVLELNRRMRRSSRVAFDRYFRMGAKFLAFAAVATSTLPRQPSIHVTDLTELSHDGATD